MGVDVDEPGGDDAPVGVELAIAVQVGADLGDASVVADRDVGADRSRAGAVDDGAPSDDDVCAHVGSPSAALARAARASSPAFTPRIRSRSCVTGGPALVPPSIGITMPVICADRSLTR